MSEHRVAADDAPDTASSVRRWVELTLGCEVSGLVRQPGGDSRQTWIADLLPSAAGPHAAVVRVETGTGGFVGSPFTLAREAEVCRALESSPVPAPRVYAVSATGDMAVFERLSGRTDFAFDDVSEREAVLDSYIENLAELHAVDQVQLDLPSLRGSTHDENWARLDLAGYRQLADAHRELREPVLDEAIDWLGAHTPTWNGRAVLLHGDAGVGNFLHDNGAVTGLIDWELSHIGDPMDDLAWLWFRDMLNHVGDLGRMYRKYADITGASIDTSRLVYYRIFVLMRCALATTVIHLSRPHLPRYETGAALLRARLGQAMCEAGITTEATQAAAAASTRPLPPLPQL